MADVGVGVVLGVEHRSTLVVGQYRTWYVKIEVTRLHVNRSGLLGYVSGVWHGGWKRYPGTVGEGVPLIMEV